MAKSRKVHQKKDDSFDHLAEALEKESEKNYRFSLRYKSYGLYSILSLLALIFFIGWFVYGKTVNDKHSDNKVVYKAKFSQSTLQSSSSSSFYETGSSFRYGLQTDYTKSLTATKQEFKFDWDLVNYEALEVGNGYDTFGTELSKVVAEHGRASRAYQDEYSEDISLVYAESEYGVYDDRRRIELHFNKNGKEYYLTQKRASSLTDSAFPAVSKEKGSANFKWTQEKFDQVVVGDAETGEGGESYEDIIKNFGLPVESELYINNTSSELYLNYIGGDATNFSQVDVRFKMQADGTYRVYIKNGSFSKNLMEDND